MTLSASAGHESQHARLEISHMTMSYLSLACLAQASSATGDREPRPPEAVTLHCNCDGLHVTPKDFSVDPVTHAASPSIAGSKSAALKMCKAVTTHHPLDAQLNLGTARAPSSALDTSCPHMGGVAGLVSSMISAGFVQLPSPAASLICRAEYISAAGRPSRGLCEGGDGGCVVGHQTCLPPCPADSSSTSGCTAHLHLVASPKGQLLAVVQKPCVKGCRALVAAWIWPC